MILYIALRDAVEALGRRDSVTRFSTADGYSISPDPGRGFRVTRAGCVEIRGVPLSNVTSWHEVPDEPYVPDVMAVDPSPPRVDPNVKRRR